MLAICASLKTAGLRSAARLTAAGEGAPRVPVLAGCVPWRELAAPSEPGRVNMENCCARPAIGSIQAGAGNPSGLFPSVEKRAAKGSAAATAGGGTCASGFVVKPVIQKATLAEPAMTRPIMPSSTIRPGSPRIRSTP